MYLADKVSHLVRGQGAGNLQTGTGERVKRIVRISLLSWFILGSTSIYADPPPPAVDLFSIDSCTVGVSGAVPIHCQGQTAPTYNFAPGVSITAENIYVSYVGCSSDFYYSTISGTGSVEFTGSALFTGSPSSGGVYIPGAVISSEDPEYISLGVPPNPHSTYHYTLTSEPLPPPIAANGFRYFLFSYGNVSRTCPAAAGSGSSYVDRPATIFFGAGAMSQSAAPQYFLVAPSEVPPDLGPCDESSTRSGCAQTPEPIEPANGNESLTEPDDYISGDGRLRLSRAYNSAVAATGFGSYTVGLGWQHNYAARQITSTNQMRGLLPRYSVSNNYATPSAACSQGWADVSPGQPSSAGVTATYSGGVCQLSNGQSWPVYSRGISADNPSTYAGVVIRRPGGASYLFACNTASCTGNSSVALSLTPTATGFTLIDEDDTSETYDSSGALQTVTYRGGYSQTFTYNNRFLSAVADSFGRTLSFNYGPNGQLQSVVTPGGQLLYGYDKFGRLTSVTYPGGSTRRYSYDNAQYPYALTNVTDENGAIYATISYDALGRANASNVAGVAWGSAVNYEDSSAPIVTDALGVQRTYHYTKVNGRPKLSSISGPPCYSCNSPASATYDAAGYYQSQTDWNGNTTQYVYDTARGLEASHIEAFGTPNARTVTTQWHPSFRLPIQITEPNRTTTLGYDPAGNLLSRTTIDALTNTSRTWNYSYNNYGQVLTIDGPRNDVNDVTTFAYYACTTGAECGQLQSITDAVGRLTVFNTYNANSQPLTITDPNGVITTLVYDARQRLSSRSVGTETTSFTYHPMGKLEQATLPDGSYIRYGYDGAHRLTDITDSAGNSVHYLLDAIGNRTQELVTDPNNLLARTGTRIFDSLGRLSQKIGAAAQVVHYNYDDNGNVLSIQDASSRTTQYGYDALNRLVGVVDSASHTTRFGYDQNDNVLSVTDPRNLQTTFGYNALGDETQLVSPDTSTTLYVRDAAGNLSQAVDARNKVSTYSYDAVNRVSQIVYADQTIQFSYDAGVNGKGHLTQVNDGSGTTQWNYDAHGRPLTRHQMIDTKSFTNHYVYNAAGQLSTVTTPSGQVIAYAYSNNRIASISINGIQLLNGVLYQPFGPTMGWQWGNGTFAIRQYNTDGQLTTVDSAGQLTYTYNLDGSIASRSDATHGPDSTTPGLTALAVSTTSNRLTSASGVLTRTYNYDTAGNIVSDGTQAYTYSDAGRMATVGSGSVMTSYLYNAMGQRVRKANSTATTYFAYDEAGQLLGEYDQTGALIQELVWFDNIPVASIRANENGQGVGVFYIHTDHLNAPTKLTRSTDNAIVWRWDHDPYGNGVPNEDPDGNGLFVSFNLRFPGQYADSETGLLYNWNRYYDPQSGRYITSDPIGLGGGINTYAYVGGNPISFYDPIGLWAVRFEGYLGAGGAVVFGKHDDRWFFGGRLGFGYGLESDWKGSEWEKAEWGSSLEPGAEIPGPEIPEDACGSGGILGVTGRVSGHSGPFGGSFETGPTRNVTTGQYKWINDGSLGIEASTAVGGTVSIGAQVFLYGAKQGANHAGDCECKEH
jgi:RHS repeat-associated protein